MAYDDPFYSDLAKVEKRKVLKGIYQLKTTWLIIYIRTVSSHRLLSTLLIQLKLVYWPLEQRNMHSSLDFCPRLARKETNVPLPKREAKSLLS